MCHVLCTLYFVVMHIVLSTLYFVVMHIVVSTLYLAQYRAHHVQQALDLPIYVCTPDCSLLLFFCIPVLQHPCPLRFLYSVVGKLSSRGYQPHLQDLLLRLNFNGYYDT